MRLCLLLKLFLYEMKSRCSREVWLAFYFEVSVYSFAMQSMSARFLNRGNLEFDQ